ncbi:hypothetical protein ACJMK2_032204, partial [Sinanodonta woodiana]
CRRGTYGLGCNGTCGNCYKGNISCSLIDGMCKEDCDAGWHGDICKLKCDTGTYGFNCNETCGYCLNGNNSCSKISGQCSGVCQTGWKGDTCKSECELGTYGFHCNETCGYCLNGNKSCSKTIGRCSGGCQSGWMGDTCKSECEAGKYGFHCNMTCGYCLNGNNSCSKISGHCSGGCKTGWSGETCGSECEVGTYGFNCNETCGYCSNGNNGCSKISGQCSGDCQTGWRGETCKSGTLDTVTPGDDGPNNGVIVGSVLAALGVSITAMVIIIIIVKRRKMRNDETGTEHVTTFTNYDNLAVGDPEAAIKFTLPSREESETAISASKEANVQMEIPIGESNSHSGVMETDVPVHTVYEKLRDVPDPESTESVYSTINPNLINEPSMNTIQIGSNYIETLQELESALKIIEEEIGVILDRKGKLLRKELEKPRAIKLRDMRKETDSTQLDTHKDYTYVNLASIDAMERSSNFVKMLQSLEGDLRLLQEKRKCLFERRETLLRQELTNTFKI